TLHSHQKKLHCHYCDFKKDLPQTCPKCEGVQIRELGFGTERVESEIKKMFPTARVARLDRDTMTQKKSWETILKKLNDHEIDILVGTQMIAKGHDYPHITLVGILNADTALNFPDFRAAERTFQILLQVSGRAGRAEHPGHVMIQTYRPEHPCFQDLETHNVVKFFQDEIAERKPLFYPPFSRLVRLEFNGLKEERVSEAAHWVAKRLQSRLSKETNLLGPAPCPLHRLRNRFRWHLLLKTSSLDKTRATLKELLDGGEAAGLPSGVRLLVDVDPIHLL
ncbi:MAG: primosomal protein N', partial [bacterium]|nr:primosomal protein N' [bacterium]